MIAGTGGIPLIKKLVPAFRPAFLEIVKNY